MPYAAQQRNPAHRYRASIPNGDVTTRRGTCVTTPARTIIDAASSGAAPDQIQMAVRQAVQEGRTTPNHLAKHAERTKDTSHSSSKQLGSYPHVKYDTAKGFRAALD